MIAMRIALLAALPVFWLSATHSVRSPEPSQDSIRRAIAARLRGAPPAPLTADTWRHVRRLYDRAGDSSLWLDGTRLQHRAESLTNALASAYDEALRLDAYPVAALRTALAPLRDPSPTITQLADVDVLLTSAYAALGEDRLTGQIFPKSISRDWHIDPRETGIDSLLASALNAPSFDSALADLQPPHENYRPLQRELARYRGIVAAGGWMRQPGGGTLKLGDSTTATRLTALATRLRAEGFLAEGEPATRFDESAPARGSYDAILAHAVATYQQRHGLTVDSTFGPATRASMDVSSSFRLQEIAANLERLRWIPRRLGDRYVLVNVPTFSLTAYDGGKLALTLKVIVGAEFRNRATPTFSDSMSYVVFRPYWNVPTSIATNEIWPSARRDATYLARNNYEVVRTGGATRIRQKPGPENSLGLIKFIFPNDFSIYIHDTPARQLFDQRVRTFSHGCIRVQHPEELAEFALGNQGWSTEQILEAMKGGRNDRRVNLAPKLPVYIVYFTTYVVDGELYFAPDPYDRDAPIVRAVARAAMPTDADLAVAEGLREAVTEIVGR
ncbi:MAG: murein L,D-transpeptidase [Gemmatimonadales bacterium]